MVSISSDADGGKMRQHQTDLATIAHECRSITGGSRHFNTIDPSPEGLRIIGIRRFEYLPH